LVQAIALRFVSKPLTPNSEMVEPSYVINERARVKKKYPMDPMEAKANEAMMVKVKKKVEKVEKNVEKVNKIRKKVMKKFEKKSRAERQYEKEFENELRSSTRIRVRMACWPEQYEGVV
jgi:phage terminase small subunit